MERLIPYARAAFWWLDERLRLVLPSVWEGRLKRRLIRPQLSHYRLVGTAQAPGFPEGAVSYLIEYRPGALERFRQTHLFQGGLFQVFARRYPAFLAGVGIRLRADGLLEYPSVALLNANLDRAGDAGPPLRFRQQDSTAAVPQLDFARCLAQEGKVLISAPLPPGDTGTNFQFHDFFVHLPGYLLLPGPVVAATRARFSRLLAAGSNREVAAEVERLDRISAAIGRVLGSFDGSTRSALRAFLFLQGRGVLSYAAAAAEADVLIAKVKGELTPCGARQSLIH